MLVWSFAFLVSFTASFLYALWLYWFDRYEREPLPLLLGLFVWGAVVAALGAWLLNSALALVILDWTHSEGLTQSASASVVAPLVEESLKGLAVLLALLTFPWEFDSWLDGMIYAGMVALGFAATENALYIQRGYMREGFGGLLALTLLRTVFIGWQHPLYTAFIGLGLAYARLVRTWEARLLGTFGGWSVAVLTHALHNTLARWGGLLVLPMDWAGWAFMLVIALLARHRDRVWLRRYLRDEVERGTLTPEQYLALGPRRREALRRAHRLGAGPVMQRFLQISAKLAFAKARADRLGATPDRLAHIEALRAQVARLAAYLRETAVTPAEDRFAPPVARR